MGPAAAHVDACRALDRARVPYVMIGVAGVSFYAEQAGLLVTTQDCDLLLPARLSTLIRAIRALARIGFRFEAGGEPLPEPDPIVVRGIVRARAVVRAFRGRDRLDLALQAAGMRFSEALRRHRTFRVRGISVHVAPLEQLIRSKTAANRPKDRVFLEVYRDALEQFFNVRPRAARTSRARRSRR